MRLSIIIPVYNVEQWVGRCLESCLNQDIPKDDYEIICVDDGSNDNSMRIVEHYAENYNNIVLFYQKNAGQSVARNHGLHHAKGEYVWFVDSDDWVQANCLGELLKTLDSHKLDVLCFTFQFVDEDGTIRPDGYSIRKSNIVMKGGDFIAKTDMPAGPWAAIHRREFLEINDIHYIKGIKREDEDFTVRAYCTAQRIEFVNVVAYNYFQRSGSTMKSATTSKAAYDMLTVADSLYNFANSKIDKSSNGYYAVLNRVSFAFSQALAYCKDGVPTLSEFRMKPYYPLSINAQLTQGLRRKYRLINLSLRLYLLLYKIAKK